MAPLYTYLYLLCLCDTVLIVAQEEGISYFEQDVYFTTSHAWWIVLYFSLINRIYACKSRTLDIVDPVPIM